MGLEVGSINTGKSSGLYCGQFVRNNKVMLIVSDRDSFKESEEIQKKIDAVLERKYAPDPSGKMAKIDAEIEKMVDEKYPKIEQNPLWTTIIDFEKNNETQREKYRNELREAVKRTNPDYKKYRDLQDKYDEEYKVLADYYRKKFTSKSDYLLL